MVAPDELLRILRRRLQVQTALAFSIVLVLGALPLAADPIATGNLQSQCWDPTHLRSRKGEELIRKNVPEAHVLPPDRQLSAYQAIPADRRKALRRVDLPPGSRKLIALTFDLCEQPYEVAGYQGGIVDFLRQNGIRATFFAGGKWMLSHRTRAQQLIADPLFEVGNHSWEHRNLRLLKGAKLRDEIINAELAYEEVRGELPASCPLPGVGNAVVASTPQRMSLFRFPFGACNPEALRAVGEAGLIPVQWDISSGDPTPGLSVPRMVHQVVSRALPGSIVLFHANGRGWKTPASLPTIVAELQRRGYEFATVSELMSVPGARPVFTDICFDATPGDTNRYDGFSRRLEEAYARFTAAQARGSVPPVGPTANIPAESFVVPAAQSATAPAEEIIGPERKPEIEALPLKLVPPAPRPAQRPAIAIDQ